MHGSGWNNRPYPGYLRQPLALAMRSIACFLCRLNIVTYWSTLTACSRESREFFLWVQSRMHFLNCFMHTSPVEDLAIRTMVRTGDQVMAHRIDPSTCMVLRVGYVLIFQICIRG